MEGKEAIVGKILSDAQQKADAIVAEARERAAAMKAEAERAANGSLAEWRRALERESTEVVARRETVASLDNRKAILFVRGERPMLDDKYDLMRHPNIRLTEDGGAPPYLHSPQCMYEMRRMLSGIRTEE